MSKKLNVGIVGATGMVGQTFVKLLEETNFPINELRPFASEGSIGKKIQLFDRSFDIQVLKKDCFKGLDLVFFSSGDDISKEWAPQAVASGAFAVDNSAAFRMDDTKVLCVPEINAHLIDKKTPQIIANPNCSTIQLVVALKPLMDRFGLEKVVTSTYQAVSGAGQQAYDELAQQVKSWTQGQELNVQQFPHQIAFNLIPQIGSFLDNGFSSEEMKIIKETKKILGNSQIKVSAMTVRVPVLNAHSEAVWVTLTQRVALGDILSALESQKGLVLSKTGYPMPKDCSDKNPVYVGRVHQDMDDPHTWIFWVVADNIRKGAAWNGLQIAAHLFDIAI